jgi:hypothetical protein
MRFTHTQECMAGTANDETSVAYLTLSIEGTPDEERTNAIDEAVRLQGGRTVWRVSEAVGRTYALLDLPDAYDAQAIRAVSDGDAYEEAIIALAVSPTVAQALPHLRAALAGPGGPAGILACRPYAGGVVVEWDPNVSRVDLVLGVIDVELLRFSSGRTIELLSPLPASLATKIAGDGLQAPQIGLDRVLESYFGDA